MTESTRPAAPRGSQLDERRWRLYVLLAIIAGCSVVLAGKLFYIQVVEHERYAALAAQEHWQREVIPARRGVIRAADGRPLAATVPFEALYATVERVGDVRKAAEQLAPILGVSTFEVESRLRSKTSGSVMVHYGLTADAADRVRQLRLSGFTLRPVTRRSYPEGNLASQVLGVVGVDGYGLSGVESALNDVLAGKPGAEWAERDTDREAIAIGTWQIDPPTDGADVTLTIDAYIQQVAERELAAGVSAAQAKSGTVVVLDPRTGAVLAMAFRPALAFDDPNLFAEENKPLFRVPAVQDTYEPGSVFKIVTMAAGLETGIIAPETQVMDSGSFRFASGTVRNAVQRPPEMITMTQVLQRSSNVGAAHLGVILGPDRLFGYFDRFGFGRKTGIELGGDESGSYRRPGAPGWDDYDLAAQSFGQGVAVTPLQMAVAVAAVANGGTLMQPYVVASARGPGVEWRRGPTIVRQAISPRTARQLTEMMVAVVEYSEDGKPRLSKIPGYRVAGKTGTSEIATPTGYARDRTIASFVGFAPADDPRFVVLVKIDELKSSPWGEQVAAPVFARIAQQLLVYFRAPPDSAQ